MNTRILISYLLIFLIQFAFSCEETVEEQEYSCPEYRFKTELNGFQIMAMETIRQDLAEIIHIDSVERNDLMIRMEWNFEPFEAYDETAQVQSSGFGQAMARETLSCKSLMLYFEDAFKSFAFFYKDSAGNWVDMTSSLALKLDFDRMTWEDTDGQKTTIVNEVIGQDVDLFPTEVFYDIKVTDASAIPEHTYFKFEAEMYGGDQYSIETKEVVLF